MAGKRVIALLTRSGGPFQTEDWTAGVSLLPGHLVVFNAAGAVVKHNTASGATSKSFALERNEMGKDIDAPYAVGDVVKVGMFAGGERVLAFIPSGANIAKAALLESNGDGTLKAGSGVPIGRAMEAVNNTAGPGEARITVEVI
jgi:hypothetical protein